MRNVLTLAIVAVAMGSSALLAQPAAASCLPPDPVAQIARADVIAFGRVVAGGSGGGPVVFQASTVYKGTLSGGSVTVETGPGGGAVSSVDYQAAPGEHTLYLQGAGRRFSTNSCSGSHPGAPTVDEARLLGAGTPAPPGENDPGAGVGLAATVLLLAGATGFFLFRMGVARRAARDGA